MIEKDKERDRERTRKRKRKRKEKTNKTGQWKEEYRTSNSKRMNKIQLTLNVEFMDTILKLIAATLTSFKIQNL